ncbi:uncharacterized protein MONOS_5034 [Monocercomonoides exilis]|uniref:uncharacterized protein n=1 Tax=Monocercomonoides exilis TaxID=2049356 RepID=UPI003559821D|nr:hypothetical protein MONOS_5034 [Monocercomonoides exilis]|eukprot:MONOS_5034.1-p1 / transcript=MONOS_5034.1 / gene=MONOS_5034 / organism=Monocercomonoides_exilis_PA203 / gene_product=unspecified product / transcript_product=unspecified product / location=Mono_scaffold00142:39755-40387(+) / protein_length=156 / sequence_SO=supercontig / SO=protein_coding / is_pseudo=false
MLRRQIKKPNKANQTSTLTIDDLDAKRIEQVKLRRAKLTEERTKLHLGSPEEKRTIKSLISKDFQNQLNEKEMLKKQNEAYNRSQELRDGEYQRMKASEEAQREIIRKQDLLETQMQNRMITQQKREIRQAEREAEIKAGPMQSPFFASFGTTLP